MMWSWRKHYSDELWTCVVGTSMYPVDGQELIKAGLVLRSASFRGWGNNLPEEIEAPASN